MKKCKVYSDGSHYIAIRPTEGYSGPRRKPPPEEPIIVEEAAPSDVQNAVVEECAAPQGQEQTNGDMPEQTQSETVKERHISTRAEEFLKWYRESYGMKKKEQYAFIASKLAPYFESDEALHKYLDYKMECKRRSETARRIRIRRRRKKNLKRDCSRHYPTWRAERDGSIWAHGNAAAIQTAFISMPSSISRKERWSVNLN